MIDPGSDNTAPKERRIGGKYVLRRRLGGGGMGTVYDAENTWTSRRVAIKVLRPELASDAEVVRRFLQEARAASSVAHPNIVDVLDLGQEDDGSFFLVQEFLEGEDLAALLGRRGTLAPREALELLVPVMGALAAAHARGIVHRDLKPENIFLVREGDGTLVPKLIDFGVSKALSPEVGGISQTRTGTAVGTPAYMAPEQARGQTDVDGRLDVWSMGVVLFEALSGRLPFESPNYNVLMSRLLTERPPRLREVHPAAPAHLADVIDAALEPDREIRTRSMGELLVAVLATPEARGERPEQSLLALHRKALGAIHDRAAAVGDTVVSRDSAPTPSPRRDSGTVGSLDTLASVTPAETRRAAPTPVPQRRRHLVAALGLAAITAAAVTLALRNRAPDPSSTPARQPAAPATATPATALPNSLPSAPAVTPANAVATPEPFVIPPTPTLAQPPRPSEAPSRPIANPAARSPRGARTPATSTARSSTPPATTAPPPASTPPAPTARPATVTLPGLTPGGAPGLRIRTAYPQ